MYDILPVALGWACPLTVNVYPNRSQVPLKNLPRGGFFSSSHLLDVNNKLSIFCYINDNFLLVCMLTLHISFLFQFQSNFYFLPSAFATVAVVPLPKKGSRIKSPFLLEVSITC